MSAAPSEVELTPVGLERGRPPLAFLRVDVALRNYADGPRWFLLPVGLGDTPVGTAGGGVSGVEVYTFGEARQVVLGRFYGSGGFKALLAPAGATLRLRRLAIELWGRPAGAVPVTVTIAATVTIGGEPAEDWFGGPATSAAGAEVMADRGEMIAARDAPNGRELPVALIEAQRLTLLVTPPPG